MSQTSAQSQATRRYESKIGLISKSYKLKKDVVEASKKPVKRMVYHKQVYFLRIWKSTQRRQE